jgi:hypothetical protein
MVNNSTNIIKTNNQLKQLNNKKKTTYGVGNPGRCLGQAQICGWVKPVVCIFFFIVLLPKEKREIYKALHKIQKIEQHEPH